jgi:ornithine--oxo-acid transaminase
MEEGMLCKDTHETIIRIAPPLVITKEDIDWAVATLEKVLNENLG